MPGELPTEGCQGNSVLSPGVPCATYNVCVLGIDERIWRITQELRKNVSARVTAMSENDKKRIDSYYEMLIAYTELAAENMQDFHYQIEFALTDILAIQGPVENEAINSALQYLWGADVNLRQSQSARLNDGLLPQDKEDFLNAVKKSQSMVNNAFDNFNPLDMPQSNPRRAVVAPTEV